MKSAKIAAAMINTTQEAQILVYHDILASRPRSPSRLSRSMGRTVVDSSTSVEGNSTVDIRRSAGCVGR